MRRLVRCGKEALDQLCIRHHGPAGVHEQEHFSVVLARWVENEFDLPAVAASLIDACFEIQFLLSPETL
jgi:hypothetical protein